MKNIKIIEKFKKILFIRKTLLLLKKFQESKKIYLLLHIYKYHFLYYL